MKANKAFKVVEIQDSQNKYKLSRDIIWILMFAISFIHGLMCISQGILSSCVTKIKEELFLSDEDYGMFGTISGFGSLTGSLIFTLIIERVSHKYLLCSMLIINCLSHFAFFFKMAYPILLFSRFISGFASVFCYIYFPMWVDEFGFKDWLNFMQTTVQVSNTIGKIYGYFFYYYIGSSQWKYGFLTEVFSVCLLTLLLAIIPDIYYDKCDDEDVESEYNIVNSEEKVKLKNENNENNINVNTDLKKEKCSIKKGIIFNIPFILINFYRANRIFIVVAIDFWYSDYLQNTLLISEPFQIFLSYSIAIVLSPLIGLLLGGFISKNIGGPKGKYSFKAILYLFLASLFFGILSHFQNNINYFTTLLSFHMILSSASGLISISASYAVVPKNLIGPATGIYSIIVNLLGFLPSPYTYAFLKHFFENGNYIILFLMIYGIFGALNVFVADEYMKMDQIFIYKEDKKINNNKNNELVINSNNKDDKDDKDDKEETDKNLNE